ncbi:hypothetical protein ACFLXC_04570 [Chloroflexota bacterium]
MVKLEVLNPSGKIQKVDKRPLAPRPSSLDGKRIGLVYNLKTGGDTLLARTAELLKERYKIKEVSWYKRPCCMAPPEGYIEDAAAGSDVIIAAAAD